MPKSFVARDLQKRMQIFSDREFTGLVEVGIQNDTWLIHFVSGSVVWLESSRYPLRRWERQLSIHNPIFYSYINQPASSSYKSWNYGALAELVKSGRFPCELLFKMAEDTIAENFFDILQIGTQNSHRTGSVPTYRAKAREIGHLPGNLMYHNDAWRKAQQDWNEWAQSDLSEISPDWLPVLSKVEDLRARTSPQTFETLSRFMDGQNTLRDLALRFNQSLPTLTKAVLPYIHKGLLRFAELPNLVENYEHVFYPELFVSDLATIDLLSRAPVESVQALGHLSVSPEREKAVSDQLKIEQPDAQLRQLRVRRFI